MSRRRRGQQALLLDVLVIRLDRHTAHLTGLNAYRIMRTLDDLGVPRMLDRAGHWTCPARRVPELVRVAEAAGIAVDLQRDQR